MSCIRFTTSAQRNQMRKASLREGSLENPPTMLTPEQAAARHPVPAVTESKIRRLRLLAADRDPKIRESVASSHHTPVDVFATLSGDSDAGVRGCVARNERVPLEILRSLARDETETVRGWVAVNPCTPDDVMNRLAGDSSETVRGIVVWKSDIRPATPVDH